MNTTDQNVRLGLQKAGDAVANLFPGRSFVIFIPAAETGQRCHYVSNAKRSQVIELMKEMIANGEPKALPENPETN